MDQYIILSVMGCLGTTVLVQAHKFACTEAHTNLKHPKSWKMNNSNGGGCTAFPKVSPFPVMLVEHQHGVISEWLGRIVEYHVRDMVTVYPRGVRNSRTILNSPVQVVLKAVVVDAM